MTRTDTPETWDERSVLNTFLDYARATVRAKCEGVSAEDARRAPLPNSPLMTLCGLVNHLRWGENWWIGVILLDHPDMSPITDDDPDGEFAIAVDTPLDVLLDEYDAQAQQYRELLAPLDLDMLAKRNTDSGKQVTLRWVLMHLIEETARHNGHIDIIREILDGVTGD
ncbi:MAG TPA: DinB family protein [Pseudonocardiaceae bacterium]|jgi:uncharacterized damage-inducible protein DinB